MIVRLFNGPNGSPERVAWKADKLAPLEPDKAVRRFEFRLGNVDADGVFTEISALQVLRLPEPVDLPQAMAILTARAKVMAQEFTSGGVVDLPL